MARLLFGQAPWYLIDPHDGLSKHGMRAGCRWPSLGLGGRESLDRLRGNSYLCYPFHAGYAAAWCQAHGHDVFFYDAIAWYETFAVYYQRVEEFAPDIVFLEMSSASLAVDLQAAHTLADMGIKVCLVGPHASTYAETLIQEPFVTYVAQGEYDCAALAIAHGGAGFLNQRGA